MAGEVNGSDRGTIYWRTIGWGGALLLLLLPLVAMRLTTEVNWTASDFIAFGIMLLAVGIPLELVVRTSHSRAYRGGAALAVLGAFLVVWTNLAVGIVGSEDNPANLLFFCALLLGVIAASIGRFTPRAMARAMMTIVIGLGIAFAVAVSAVTDEPQVSHLRELLGTSVFAGIFLSSAGLFRLVPPNSPVSSLPSP
jgi:hypothetical protein